jgi:hypothetical protein
MGHYREACVFIHTDISSSTYHFQYIMPIPLHWNLQYTSSHLCTWRIIYMGIIGTHMFHPCWNFFIHISHPLHHAYPPYTRSCSIFLPICSSPNLYVRNTTHCGNVPHQRALHIIKH